MRNIFHREAKTAPITNRYPEALAELLTLGKPTGHTNYQEWAARLKDYVPDLIRMVLDEDLNQRHENDPAVWAPIHALEVLSVLRAEEAAHPLTACLASHDEWTSETLPKVYASIGPAAVPVLQTYLDDAANDPWGRIHASSALSAIAQAHPAVKAQTVAYLTAFLDRPAADDSADEERLTTFVITDLCDLDARSAYPAIRRAYAENRVDPQITTLEDVEADLGMRPKPDYSKLPAPRQEPGVRLALRCKACGRERSYLFPKVYYDLGTMRDEKKRAKYDPVIIPQRVVCQKCGAVDQYELGSMGQVALLASTLAQIQPELKGLMREDQRVQYMEFTTRWGKMHPLEAIERYQAELARRPADPVLHVGYGNVLRFLGRADEAEAEYRRAAELNPDEPEALINLAQVAAGRNDRVTAIGLWQRALEVLPNSRLPTAQRRNFQEAARAALTALKAGLRPADVVELAPPGMAPTPAAAGPKTATRPTPPRSVPKVRRNEPCPCGSGKKYKHCHGRRK